MEGKQLEREIKTIQNMLAQLLQENPHNGYPDMDLEITIDAFRPKPQPIKEVDPSSDLLDRPEIKELLYAHWSGEITDEEYIKRFRELAGRKPVDPEKMKDYVEGVQ